jgi:phenylacetic acid degradation operon negative regulatory protein
MNLSKKILTFIGYCLKETGFRYSYEKMAEALERVDKKRYSVATLRKEFSNLKRNGFITYEPRCRRKIPTLTRAGKLKIAPSLPYKKYDSWDCKWRIVIFSIPEKERNFRLIFQKKLEDLGFQKIQNGVYISPHPLVHTIARIATELGLRQHIVIVEADKIDREKWEIQKIWKLEQINQEYQGFIKEARKIRRREFWPLLAKQLEEEFHQIYKKDPHLPSELLPKNWLGDKAYQIYKEIIRSY